MARIFPQSGDVPLPATPAAGGSFFSRRALSGSHVGALGLLHTVQDHWARASGRKHICYYNERNGTAAQNCELQRRAPSENAGSA